MITICKQCGGLRASPGESFAGTPCNCRAASLLHWLKTCSKSTPLLTEYDRLKGTKLLGRGEATGRFADEAREFFDFCVDMWTRIPSENDQDVPTKGGENKL